MKVSLRSAPRIVVDVVAEVGGEEFDLVELNNLLEALELGDVDIEDDEIADKLHKMAVVEYYVRDGVRRMTAGRRFAEFLAAVRTAIDVSNIDLPLSRE